MDTYRGSPKHKNRPGTGRKGTLCPEWTHAAGDLEFSGDPFAHPWKETCAHALFAKATPTADDRRYATARGIAFEAKPTGDGSWHGYPVPWESVPPAVVNQWLSEGKVTRRELRLNRRHEASNIHWALGADEP
ncbi:hypothetical protein ACUH78_13270 [Thauera sp. ZXT1-4]|uniref:hypothetical protein n=1 Tax=Thauera sp. ZXT1-4 TaxID=3460294 RepID=UPI0040408240